MSDELKIMIVLLAFGLFTITAILIGGKIDSDHAERMAQLQQRQSATQPATK